MFSLTIWGCGLVLITVLLARAFAKRLVSRYPLFYGYLSFVLLTSNCLLAIYLVRPEYYRPFYWYVEFVTAALGCGVVWEIYRGALKRFPGAARMARNVLLFLLAVVLSKAIADTWNGTAWQHGRTFWVEAERDLRGAQGIVLIGLIAVIALYRIPMGSNLWGMTLGYGLLIGSNVISLTLRAFLGEAFQNTWRYVQPLSYLAVLCVWGLALWSYRPAAAPKGSPEIEEDYEVLVASTTNALLRARLYLRRTLRP